MLVNFEELTKDLNEKELEMCPVVVEIITKNGSKSNPIKSYKIQRIINGAPNLFDSREKLSGVRLRKIINAIRSNGTYPIMASSNGYYISFDKEDIQKQISSLIGRAHAINQAVQGLKGFLDSGNSEN